MNKTENQPNILDTPLSFNELIGGGATFNIEADFSSEYNETHVSDDDDFESDHETKDDPDVELKIISPWTKPFGLLREQMERINDDIYKLIIRRGDKTLGKVPLNARVQARYNAYWEGDGSPFDSTYLRGSIYQFYTGRRELLTGLEAAFLTMYVGEQAQFVISYKLLFGELGCPPRIKPKTDALFILEVLSFALVGSADADKELAEEDRKKFPKVIEKAKQIHIKGLDFFRQGMYKNACRTFERAVDVLKMCRLANEQEELDQKAFLIKLHTNLAVCYIKLNAPKRTCLMCNEINRLTKNKPSCKALFQEGRALLMLGEYTRAKSVLVRAYNMEPQNKDIINELNELENRFAAYKKETKNIWQKAIGVYKDTVADKTQSKTQQDQAFENEMLSVMQSFKNNVAIDEFQLPNNLTEDELKSMNNLAKSLDLVLKVAPGYDQTKYTLKKPAEL